MNKKLLELIQPDLDETQIRDLCRSKREELEFDIEKALFPTNPFDIDKALITIDDALILLKDWDSVGDSVWASVRDSVRDSVQDSVWVSVGDSVQDSVGDSVWVSVRDSVRDSVWVSVGDSVQDSVGDSVWVSVRDSVRDSVQDSVWVSVRDSVRDSVQDSVWAYISSIFNIEKWLYIDHETGVNPFQSAIDLWESGYVASFDGQKWRLHCGKNAEIVWCGEIKDI